MPRCVIPLRHQAPEFLGAPLHKPACPERLPPFRIQRSDSSLPINGNQEHSAGFQYSVQLGQPEILHGFVEVGKHREAVGDVEVVGGIWQRRYRPDSQKMTLAEIPGAPIDCIRVDVNSMELGPAALAQRPTDGAAAPASEIKHSIGVDDIRAHIADVLSNEICATRAHPEEFAHRQRLAYAKTQEARRHGNFRRRNTSAVRAPNSCAKLQPEESVIDGSGDWDEAQAAYPSRSILIL
jgi:hypothetical protein